MSEPHVLTQTEAAVLVVLGERSQSGAGVAAECCARWNLDRTQVDEAIGLLLNVGRIESAGEMMRRVC